MLNWFSNAANDKLTVSQTMTTDVGKYVDEKIWRDLCSKIVDAWFKEYGAQVIKELKPKMVKQTVSKIIEDKLAEKFYHE